MSVIVVSILLWLFFFFSSRRRHTRCLSDWSSDVCSSDLPRAHPTGRRGLAAPAANGSHRSLVPAPRRPDGADRGRGGSDGRAGPRGQGPLPRVVRGGGDHDSPRRSEERRVGKEWSEGVWL